MNRNKNLKIALTSLSLVAAVIGVTPLGLAASHLDDLHVLEERNQVLQAHFNDTQSRINVARTLSSGARTLGGEPTWNEPTSSMKTTLVSMQKLANRLQKYYASVNSAQGRKLMADVQANLSSLRTAIDKLAETSDVRQAQLSANGIATSVNTLTKLLAELDDIAD